MRNAALVGEQMLEGDGCIGVDLRKSISVFGGIISDRIVNTPDIPPLKELHEDHRCHRFGDRSEYIAAVEALLPIGFGQHNLILPHQGDVDIDIVG